LTPLIEWLGIVLIGGFLWYIQYEIVVFVYGIQASANPTVYPNAFASFMLSLWYWFSLLILLSGLIYLFVQSQFRNPDTMYRRVKLRGLLVALLLVGSGLMCPIPGARADGSVSPQTVTSYYNQNNAPPENTTGTYDDGWVNNENALRIDYIPFHFYEPRTPEHWTYNITQVRQRQYSDSGYSSSHQVVIYKVNNESDASDLWGYDTATRDCVSGWATFNIWPEIEVDYGEHGVYVAWASGSVSGNHGVWYEERNQNYGVLEAGRTNPPLDPLTGESTTSNRVYAYTIDYKAWNVTSTTHNQYYGSASQFVARRDVNTTFPVTIALNREIKVTVPKSEYLANITYYHGGAWDEYLSSSQYTYSSLNATHDEITIPDATIALKGGAYRVFTSSYPYIYDFIGPFWENGTAYPDNVTITAYYLGNTSSHVLDGNFTLGLNSSLVLFRYNVGEADRILYPAGSTGTFYAWIPEQNYSVYQVQVKDYIGAYGRGDVWLESHRVINNSERLVERVKVQDALNRVPVIMVTARVYTLKVRLESGTVYTFGYYVSGVDQDIILSLDEIAFSDLAKFSYTYFTWEATRPNATRIRINYADSLEDTTSVDLYIKYRNGSVVTSTTYNSDSFTHNWYGADNETDYVVVLEVSHNQLGLYTYDQALPVGLSSPTYDPPSLEVLGEMGGIPMDELISVMISFLGFAGATMLFAPAGAFVGVSFMGIFRYYSWTSISWTYILIGWFLSVLYGAGLWRVRKF